MKRFKQYNLSEVSSGLVVSDPGDVGFPATEYFTGKGISSFLVPSSPNKKSPIDRYFDNNIQQSKNRTAGTMAMVAKTPGQFEVEPDSEQDEFETLIEPEDEDGREEAKPTTQSIRGMNTDALNMGPAGAADEESRKNIRRAAIARLKDAKQRWDFLKNWIQGFDVNDKTQDKIANVDVVLGINAPSIAKAASTYILPSGKRAKL